MLNEQERRRDDIPGGETHPEPVDMRDSERPAVKRPTRARAGQVLAGGVMRRVLFAGIVLVIIGFALAWIFAS